MKRSLLSKALILSGTIVAFVSSIQSLLAQDFSQWMISPKLSEMQQVGAALREIQAEPSINQTLQSKKMMLNFAGRVRSTQLVTTKFQASYQGLEVVGSMALHHQGTTFSQVSNRLAQFDLNTQPQISAETAAQIARNLNKDREIDALPSLKILPSENQDSAQLIYWVKVQARGLDASSDVLMDAHTGQVIANISSEIPIAPVEVFSAENTPASDVDPSSGAPLRFSPNALEHVIGSGSLDTSPDSSALRAASNSKLVLNYYSSHHGRDSYDDQGSATISVVHAGKNFSNAFWSTSANIMAYGDGDGVHTTDFTKGVDVAGHEMTHGVVSATSKLLSFGESGALNEAMADFFGKMIENTGDWVIGKAIFLDPKMSAKGIRNLANPEAITTYTVNDQGRVVAKPYPSQLKDEFIATGQCDGSNDNCYVHVNSTIASHTAYLITQKLGVSSAEKLMYAVMTQYLTSRSGFRMFGSAIQSACQQTLDSSSCNTVNSTLSETGLLE